jgi:hypothetical protein
MIKLNLQREFIEKDRDLLFGFLVVIIYLFTPLLIYN